MKALDLVGQRFGRLTVISKSDISKDGRCWWNCLCDCGAKKIISGKSLRTRHAVSCGCFTKDRARELGLNNRIEFGLAAFRALVKSYKKAATSRGYSFSLTNDEFRSLTSQNCWYCNRKPSSIKKAKFGNYIYTGIDRVDNNKGYSIDNCVPCCKRCNQGKNNMTTEEFMDMVKNIYEYRCKTQ